MFDDLGYIEHPASFIPWEYLGIPSRVIPYPNSQSWDRELTIQMAAEPFLGIYSVVVSSSRGDQIHAGVIVAGVQGYIEPEHRCGTTLDQGRP